MIHPPQGINPEERVEENSKECLELRENPTRGQVKMETSLEGLGPPPLRGQTSHRAPGADASRQEARGQDWGANFAGVWAPRGGMRCTPQAP